MASQAEGMHKIDVVVVNEDGQTVIGARVEISADGVPLGDFVTGGESSIETDEDVAVTLRVEIAGFSVSAIVAPGSRSQRIVIPTSRVFPYAAMPTARCPDGTAGQPCVTCQVGGRTIRICA